MHRVNKLTLAKEVGTHDRREKKTWPSQTRPRALQTWIVKEACIRCISAWFGQRKKSSKRWWGYIKNIVRAHHIFYPTKFDILYSKSSWNFYTDGISSKVGPTSTFHFRPNLKNGFSIRPELLGSSRKVTKQKNSSFWSKQSSQSIILRTSSWNFYQSQPFKI